MRVAFVTVSSAIATGENYFYILDLMQNEVMLVLSASYEDSPRNHVWIVKLKHTVCTCLR